MSDRLNKSRFTDWQVHPAYLWALGIALVGSAVYWFRKPAMNLIATPLQFVSRLWTVLGEVRPDSWGDAGAAPKLSTAAKVLIVAHAAFESDWGKGTAAKLGFNYFNITAGPAWKGEVIKGPDTEYDKAGNVKNITQQFRKYPSDRAAIEDYLSFLSKQNGGRYSKAYTALLAGKLEDFVRELSIAGYFTLPLAQYQERMAKVNEIVIKLLS